MMHVSLPFPPSMNTYAIAAAPSSLPAECGVYVMWCRPSGKFYVGSCVSFRRRMAYHTYRFSKNTHPNPAMQAAWNKHGPEAFHAGIIESIADREQLLAAEQRWLDCLSAANRPDAYNCLPVAGSHLGRKRSATTKAKMSAAQVGRTFSDKSKEKMRAARVGMKLTKTHRERIGAACRGKKINRPHGIINSAIRKFTPEQVRDIRLSKSLGESYSSLCRRYKTCAGPIYRIVHRNTYRDVE